MTTDNDLRRACEAVEEQLALAYSGPATIGQIVEILLRFARQRQAEGVRMVMQRRKTWGDVDFGDWLDATARELEGT
jgi:hypothetical protein